MVFWKKASMFLAWSFIAIIEMISLLNYLYQLIKFVYNLEHYKEILLKEDVLCHFYFCRDIYLFCFSVNWIIQWNLCNPTPEFSNILWHPTKIYGLKVFLLTKIKPERSDILYNSTHLPGPLVCHIREVLTSCTIRHLPGPLVCQIRQVLLLMWVNTKWCQMAK